MEEINEMIRFENSIYGEEPDFYLVDFQDWDYFIDRLVNFPKIRPFLLNQIVAVCKEYCDSKLFRSAFLSKASVECPVIIHRLYHLGYYSVSDIKNVMDAEESILFAYYFYTEIENFSQITADYHKSSFFDELELFNDRIENLIQYGFLPTSTEYCLKYDDIELLKERMESPLFCQESQGQWNPFEWSFEPSSFDFLSISGHFSSLKCFKHLLLNGYKINDNIMSSAVGGGSIEILRMTMNCWQLSPTLIITALDFCRMEILEFLIEQIGESEILSFFESNYTHPLHQSASRGNIYMVDYILSKNADINLSDKDKWTPLHHASWANHLHIVEYLVNNGANINAKDYDDMTPLHYAICNNNLRVVEFLVRNNADINAKENSNMTPLQQAVVMGYIPIVEFLVNCHSDVNTADTNNDTPLHFASRDGLFDIVDILVRNNANVNAINNIQSTPLHLAALNGKLSIAIFLVNHGAKVDVIDIDGNTPLHLSAIIGNMNVSRFLAEQTTNINVFNNNDQTPITLAIMYDHSYLAELLESIDGNN